MRTSASVGAVFLLATSLAAAQTPEDARLLRPVRYDLALTVDFGAEQLTGSARIRLRNEHDRPVSEASVLLYRLLAVREVRDAAGRPIRFEQTVVAFDDFGKLQVNHVRVPLTPALGPGAETTIELRYGGYLLGYAETGMAYVKDRVDSAYTLLRMDANAYPVPGYPSLGFNRRAGLPTYDYEARITVPVTHAVASGGELIERLERGASVTYMYRSVKPSWRMDFAIAPFHTLRRGEFTVFHLPADSAGAQRIMDAMARTLALYTRWFGPLEGRAPFAVIEVPDGWGSQADVTSILQTAAAFRDAKRESELYHEISHLWNVPSTDRPSPRWNEGLASFLEDLAVDSLGSRSTMDSSALRIAHWLRTRAATDSLLRSVPPASYGEREMTGYSYWVGGVMFYALYRLMNHEPFTAVVGAYYRTYAKTGASTDDFVRLAKARSPVDLTVFFHDWLYSTRWIGVVEAAASPMDLYSRYLPAKARAAATNGGRSPNRGW
jgi:hypothetical protein